MNILFGHLFWGILVILIGVSLILKGFNISFPSQDFYRYYNYPSGSKIAYWRLGITKRKILMCALIHLPRMSIMPFLPLKIGFNQHRTRCISNRN